MTRNPTSLCSDSSLRKPLDLQAFRLIATFCLIGMLFGATIGFIAVPRWDAAIVGALLAIPGGLFGGALAVFFSTPQSNKTTRATIDFKFRHSRCFDHRYDCNSHGNSFTGCTIHCSYWNQCDHPHDLEVLSPKVV